MKLLHLKILSEFRGLSAGFDIRFDGSNATGKFNPSSPSNFEPPEEPGLKPTCMVGLNGSGKSNVLEVISEVFYYLETYHLASDKELQESSSSNLPKSKRSSRFETSFGFEVSYTIPQHLALMAFNSWSDLPTYCMKFSISPVITIRKEKGEFPKISAAFWAQVIHCQNEDNNRCIEILPARIIGYSSGMNELISNPFMKMDSYYYDQFRKQSGEKQVESVAMNRMFFMDYDSNKLIAVCNFLLGESGDSDNEEHASISPLKDEIGIEDIHSFSISIKLRDANNKALELPSRLNLAIEHLKNCATSHRDETSQSGVRTLELYFWVNEETKKAFHHYFGTADNLYRDLYYLRLMNSSLISGELREKVKTVRNINISAVLPKHEESRLVFSLGGLAFKKKGVKTPVHYEKLSDGEHQLLHVLGAVVLLDTPGSLFILDEPETHFNPDWRSKFISLINECLGSGKRDQDIFLTSHSPFIVSDCREDKVYIFNRNKQNRVTYSPPGFNTFGASLNLINLKVFDKRETIAGLTQSRFEEIKSKFDEGTLSSSDAKLELVEFGDSVEKSLMLHYVKAKETD
jgi:restriction system-associated AAA family ATPase